MSVRTPRGSKDGKGVESNSGKSDTRSLEADSKAPRLGASRRRTPVSLSGLLRRFAFFYLHRLVTVTTVLVRLCVVCARIGV